MKLSAISAALILTAGWITAISAATPAAVADTCPPSMSFVVGGTGDPSGVRTPNVPAGPRTNIWYPASISPDAGTASGDESVRQATTSLGAAVAGFKASCPGSHVNLVGYSLGAVAVSNVCDTTSGTNTTCITSGNPKAENGSFAYLPSFIPGFTFNGPRVAPTNGPTVVEICNPRDLYCNGGNPLQDPGHFIDSAIGTYLQGQHAYPTTPVAPVIPSTPLPVPDEVNLQVLEPVMQAVVPDAPIRTEYVPTPVKELVPPIVADILPAPIADYIPPPPPPPPPLPPLPPALPPLPRIPGL